MNGAQDMGGMMGFGPVVPEKNEPVFHAEWERRAFALTLAMAPPGGWNIDEGRFARESLPPAEYLAKTYYEIWIAGLERLMAKRGLVSAQEIAAGHAHGAPKPVERVLTPERVAPGLARGAPTERQVTGNPRFAVGDRVLARNMHPVGHTRLPRYVRGKIGTITHDHGFHVFADTHAAGAGEQPQRLYTVRFDGRELWGADADPTVTVSVDAWDSYLEAL